jgi:curved DNA-binding protein CbpA
MKDLTLYYRILDLLPGASQEEVNQAYKDLAFIWHPDRIPESNIRLRQKAAEKLKQINEARDQLRSQPTPVQSSQSYHSRNQSAYAPYSGYSRNSAPHSPIYSNFNKPAEKPSESRAEPKKSNHNHRSDLSGADFRGCDLKEKDLSGRNLTNADLSGADLSDAFLHKINLSSANLQRANLFRANLLQANLSYANLQDTNLIGADLSGADLTGANLTGARLGYSTRIMVKLTGARLTGAIMPDGTVHS